MLFIVLIFSNKEERVIIVFKTDNFKKKLKFRVLLEIADEDFIKYIKDLVNKRKVRVIREIKENLVLLDYTYLFFGLVVDSV